MDAKRVLPNLLFVVGVLLVGAGVFRWRADGAATMAARILLGAGLAIVVNVIIARRRMRRAARGEAGFPPEDELSRCLKQRAAHAAFHLSFFWWMAIFLFQDLFDESETMLGMGILGMGVLYGISLLVNKRRGIVDENPY